MARDRHGGRRRLRRRGVPGDARGVRATPAIDNIKIRLIDEAAVDRGGPADAGEHLMVGWAGDLARSARTSSATSRGNVMGMLESAELGGVADANGGGVTITAADADRVPGTFDIGYPGDERVTGGFSAHVCL